MELALFPLHAVLFPNGLLPLKIFEQRYMTMAKRCFSDAQCFGVCLIDAGKEVGAPATPRHIGCTARIVEWDMPQLGILHIVARGEQRFRILHHTADSTGLISATVDLLAAEESTIISPEYTSIRQSLIDFYADTPDTIKPTSTQFNDASWVSHRLAELLPLPLPMKQQLLELNNPLERLGVLRDLLASNEAKN